MIVARVGDCIHVCRWPSEIGRCSDDIVLLQLHNCIAFIAAMELIDFLRNFFFAAVRSGFRPRRYNPVLNLLPYKSRTENLLEDSF